MLRPAVLLVGESRLAVSTSCPPTVAAGQSFTLELKAAVVPSNGAFYSPSPGLLCACFMPGADPGQSLERFHIDAFGAGSVAFEIAYPTIGDWQVEAAFYHSSSLSLVAHALLRLTSV